MYRINLFRLIHEESAFGITALFACEVEAEGCLGSGTAGTFVGAAAGWIGN